MLAWCNCIAIAVTWVWLYHRVVLLSLHCTYVHLNLHLLWSFLRFILKRYVYTNSAIQCQTVAASFCPLTWDNAASVSILLTGAPLPPVQSPVPLDLRMKFRIPGAASALPVGALIAL
jgi:hypothetical protein